MELYLPIAEITINPSIFLILGMSVGILSGMFGVGGGFLMTPLLVLLGIPPAVAVASEANHIVGSSLSGTIGHLRRKAVDIKLGNLLLTGGIIGSFVGISIFNSLIFNPFILLRKIFRLSFIKIFSYKLPKSF